MRASMVFIAFFFGYQKWFQYEADALIPYIYDHLIHAGWVGSLCWRLSFMTERVAFLMKDLVIFAASLLLAEAGCGQSVGLSQTSARTTGKAGSLN